MWKIQEDYSVAQIWYARKLIEHLTPKNAVQEKARQSNYSAGDRSYHIPGLVNGIPTNALPDTGCSSESCISSTLATKLGLTTKPGTAKAILVGFGRTIHSPGTVTIRWSFANDPSSTRQVECTIWPASLTNDDNNPDLILGYSFLNGTGTLAPSQWKSRVAETLTSPPTRERVQKPLSLCLIGTSNPPKLLGRLNGEITTAIPDLGSDVMALSEAYAARGGFHIDRDEGKRVVVQFADGTTKEPTGVVRGVSWSFGEGDARGEVKVDIYVLGDLPVDVILSKTSAFGVWCVCG